MRAFKSSSESKSPTTNAATRSRGFLPIALAVLASAFSFTPTAVHADTPVKGFFADEEQAPAADAKAAVSATAAPQVQVQVNVTTDANAAVAVEGDEYSVDTDPSALTDFREPLEDYGTWSDDATYGTVWYPDATVVGTDFAPYQTSGHWELDENNDWMWVSDYDWGYIPFHYGRWVWIGGRGWGWIPGRVYAPAWVSWRMTDYGYIGWAPMAPSWYWFGGNAVTVWNTPYSAYVFCPSTYVFNRRVHTYIVRDRDVIQRVGAHSRPYRPARPSVSASAASARSARAYRPASPTLADAKIPNDAAPQKRSKPDARASAFAHRSSTPQARTNAIEARRVRASQLPTQRDPSAARPNPGDARPSTLANPTNARPSARTNAVETRPVTRSVGNDAKVNTPPSRPAATPHKESHATPTKNSRPSTTTTQPSRPSTTPSRPSTTPSRPSVSPSRPSSSPSRSFTPSRPSSPSRSFSPSRGGRR